MNEKRELPPKLMKVIPKGRIADVIRVRPSDPVLWEQEGSHEQWAQGLKCGNCKALLVEFWPVHGGTYPQVAFLCLGCNSYNLAEF